MSSKKVYDLNYFSGSQVQLYIGPVLVDEIVGLAVAVQQQKVPIYGYSSQLFDAVARGPILVNGHFAINFVSAGYLFTILEKANTITTGDLAVWEQETPASMFAEGFKDLGQSDRSTILSALVTRPSQLEDFVHMQEQNIWGTSLPFGETSFPSMRPDQNRFDDFSIHIVYGNISDTDTPGTMREIRGIHLLGSEQVVQADGNPVQEVYTFLARDMT